MSTQITSAQPNKTVIDFGGNVAGAIQVKGNLTRIEYVVGDQVLSVTNKSNVSIDLTPAPAKVITEVRSITNIVITPGNATRIEPAVMGIKGDKGDPGTGGGGSGATTSISQEIVVDNQIYTNKRIILNNAPKAPEYLDLFIYGGIKQRPNFDFLLVGNIISWDSLALDLLVDVGTVISVRYDI